MTETVPSANRAFFKVIAFTADRALPVAGATVKIYERGSEEALFTLLTNTVGETAVIPLETPAAETSLSPGALRPFADYRVTVDADGYYPLKTEHIPMFAGVATTLPARLIPKSAYDSQTTEPRGETATVPNNPQALSEENA